MKAVAASLSGLALMLAVFCLFFFTGDLLAALVLIPLLLVAIGVAFGVSVYAAPAPPVPGEQRHPSACREDCEDCADREAS